VDDHHIARGRTRAHSPVTVALNNGKMITIAAGQTAAR
jgi:hypothetical protein